MLSATVVRTHFMFIGMLIASSSCIVVVEGALGVGCEALIIADMSWI